MKKTIMVLLTIIMITGLIGCGKDEKQEVNDQIVIFTYDKELDKTVIINDKGKEVLRKEQVEADIVEAENVKCTLNNLSCVIKGTVSKEYLEELKYNTKKNIW